MQPNKYEIKDLTLEDANLIMEGLGNISYIRSSPLIQRIGMQLSGALKKPEEKREPVEDRK